MVLHSPCHATASFLASRPSKLRPSGKAMTKVRQCDNTVAKLPYLVPARFQRVRETEWHQLTSRCSGQCQKQMQQVRCANKQHRPWHKSHLPHHHTQDSSKTCRCPQAQESEPTCSQPATNDMQLHKPRGCLQQHTMHNVVPLLASQVCSVTAGLQMAAYHHLGAVHTGVIDCQGTQHMLRK